MKPTVSDTQLACVIAEAQSAVDQCSATFAASALPNERLVVARIIDNARKLASGLVDHAAGLGDSTLPTVPREGAHHVVKAAIEALKPQRNPEGYSSLTIGTRKAYGRFISELYFQAAQINFECERLLDIYRVHRAEVHAPIRHPLFTLDRTLDPRSFLEVLSPAAASCTMRLLAEASASEHAAITNELWARRSSDPALYDALLYCMLEGPASANAITLLEALAPLPGDAETMITIFGNHEFIPKELAGQAREVIKGFRRAA